MNEVVDHLKKSNEAYFSGKELRFDNRASFFQCVVDPVTPGGFIAAQHRQNSDSNSNYFKQNNWYDKNENNETDEIFSAPASTDPELQEIAHTKQCDSDSEDSADFGYNDSRTIISYWKQNDKLAAGQYECWKMV